MFRKGGGSKIIQLIFGVKCIGHPTISLYHCRLFQEIFGLREFLDGLAYRPCAPRHSDGGRPPKPVLRPPGPPNLPLAFLG